MSGICGVLALNGGQPSQSEIDAIVALLERRGPDGSRSWREGPVALGHSLLATTPEALTEALPLTDAESGCTITADCRIDNREELIAALDLAGADRVIGDGELILRAYLQWGEDCPKHLLGDFAFAIWDPRTQRLFCARDHMGMRQFNYCHLPGQVFVFSTEDTGVLAHHSVPKALNEGRIADFIGDFEDVDFTSTFFESVNRLPPAHSLCVGAQGCELRRYWTLQPGPQLQLASNEAYAEAFLAVFTDAVRSRLRTCGKVASMLSGGLDSSAVTAIAASILAASSRGPLSTISAVAPDSSRCAETRAIHSALTMGGISPISVCLGDFDGIEEELIEAMQEVRNPFEVHATMLRCIYAKAREDGIKVVLDGGSGDVILASDNRIASFLSAGQVRLAIREVNDQITFWKIASPARFMAGRLLSAAWVAFAPLAIRARWRRLRISTRLPDAAPGFARRAGFANRRRLAGQHLQVLAASDPAWRAQAILHPNLASGRERYDQLAASFGVECRDPFMDLRVIAFCLSLPADQLQAGGWPKIILRRTLEKLVPKDVAWRRGKEHLGWSFTTTLLARWKDWSAGMCDLASPLGRYVSQSTLNDLRNNRNHPTGAKLGLFALDRFLRRYGKENDR